MFKCTQGTNVCREWIVVCSLRVGSKLERTGESQWSGRSVSCVCHVHTAAAVHSTYTLPCALRCMHNGVRAQRVLMMHALS